MEEKIGLRTKRYVAQLGEKIPKPISENNNIQNPKKRTHSNITEETIHPLKIQKTIPENVNHNSSFISNQIQIPTQTSISIPLPKIEEQKNPVFVIPKQIQVNSISIPTIQTVNSTTIQNQQQSSSSELTKQ